MENYRTLTEYEIDVLIENDCLADNWGNLQVVENFDPSRVYFSQFSGKIFLGSFSGFMEIDGIKRPCGIYHARLQNCTIGDDVLIDHIGSAIVNYHIEKNVFIENTFLLSAEKGAQFGNGVKVSILNEAGGRDVTLFNDLNAQVAYFQASFRHDLEFQQKLNSLIGKNIKSQLHSHGIVESGARIRNCGAIKNVQIGVNAILEGAAKLENGTILSCPEHPSYVGVNVVAQDFIVSEGAHIDAGVTMENVFVGQATQLGNQFSAENALFFANCEGFNSEVNSIFAGPYTVTHHKSTLLIASLFSFYNAGSGSNQSNHMYKLGPVHQGIFERGCKTGSFSYVLLESHIPAFSTVIGKHLTNIDAPLLPFSYITEERGQSRLMPAINLFSIGTVRDEAKWPARDRRKANQKRDLIIFDVFSPYSVEKMRRGRAMLLKMYEETPREKSFIVYGGVQISRLLLRKGAKYYGFAIDRYLIGKVISRIEKAIETKASWEMIIKQLVCNSAPKDINDWLDLSGLLALKERIERLMQDVKDDKTQTIEEFLERIKIIYASFENDEWAYIYRAFTEDYGFAPDKMTVEDFMTLVKKWEKAANSLNALILDDASKEFGDFSHIGFGMGFGENERQADFKAVRGESQTNAVVQKLRAEKEEIQRRAESIMHTLENMV